SWSGKEEGKTRWTNALWGLGLALISWLVLFTINPDLVNFGGNTLINPPAQSTNTNGDAGTNDNSTGNTIGDFSYPSGSSANTNGSGGGNSCYNCEDISGLFTIKSGTGHELNITLA